MGEVSGEEDTVVVLEQFLLSGKRQGSSYVGDLSPTLHESPFTLKNHVSEAENPWYSEKTTFLMFEVS
jgi:hypothetical protein